MSFSVNVLSYYPESRDRNKISIFCCFKDFIDNLYAYKIILNRLDKVFKSTKHMNYCKEDKISITREIKDQNKVDKVLILVALHYKEKII